MTRASASRTGQIAAVRGSGPRRCAAPADGDGVDPIEIVAEVA
jgi:hypothetical protein